MKKITFSIKNLGKELYIKFTGFLTEEDTKHFLKEYASYVSKINPSTTTLILDATDMTVFKTPLLPLLKECFKTYQNQGFEKIQLISSKQVICKTQMKRIAKDVGMDTEFIDN